MAHTSNHYDLIVLGSDIAGLVAAALVARRGKRVLVIPQESPDGTYRLGNNIYALEPTPILHTQTPALRRVFQELGIAALVRRHSGEDEGLTHLVLPGHRLDLEGGDRDFEAEAQTEWPESPIAQARELAARWREATDEVLDQLLSSEHDLVSDGFWSRRFLKNVATTLPDDETDEHEPLPPDHAVRRLVAAIEPWFLHLTPAQLGKAARLRIHKLWAHAPEMLPRGYPQLRELLLQRIELHSGEVKRGLRVGELVIRRGRVTGVTLLTKKDTYGCDNLIVALDPRRLLDGPLRAELVPKQLATTLRELRSVAARYVLHLEIEHRGLSPALGNTAVIVPETTPDEVEHGIGHTYLRITPSTIPKRSRVAITRIIDPNDDTAELRDRLVDELDERGILPFCRPHIHSIHSPHDGLPATDGSGRPLGDQGAASRMHEPMPLIYAVDGHPSLGMGILPHQSGIKALWFASRLSLPGLGLEGEFAAGSLAASAVAHPAKSPFSRSGLLSRP